MKRLANILGAMCLIGAMAVSVIAATASASHFATQRATAASPKAIVKAMTTGKVAATLHPGQHGSKVAAVNKTAIPGLTTKPGQ
ncbi:MAG TPA: hypothetical protein VEJ20_08030 [Candidatus Eremiobacteraceae bacterium]|nr:hypothetical protein [Candidatus Eremiobacteraceae bacterium]